MSLSLWGEVSAAFQKEWRAETRSRHGLFASALFSLISVVAAAFSTANDRPSPMIAAGLLTLALLFAASVTLPRLFVLEDEQGTLDLLRLVSRPEAAWLGKLLFGLVQMGLTALFLGTLFVALTGVALPNPIWLVIGLLLEALTLSAAIAVTGVLVAGASNRWLLSSVLALPLLLPQVTLSMGVLRYAFGQGTESVASQNAIGLMLYAVAALSFGPTLARLLWQLEPSKEER